ncbi:hypothetical protein XELAEV_18047759mg [Xenopus laevis]|uniref:Uncharacterized protein n=1 Tax=Xenopus laevis TaxID=8355 RepID=A0A974H261_XENLA|nr:hypothetical protein XELAEV_18047759mg [Xenopus laevis]
MKSHEHLPFIKSYPPKMIEGTTANKFSRSDCKAVARSPYSLVCVGFQHWQTHRPRSSCSEPPLMQRTATLSIPGGGPDLLDEDKKTVGLRSS